jgi:chromosome segregation ATPase
VQATTSQAGDVKALADAQTEARALVAQLSSGLQQAQAQLAALATAAKAQRGASDTHDASLASLREEVAGLRAELMSFRQTVESGDAASREREAAAESASEARAASVAAALLALDDKVAGCAVDAAADKHDLASAILATQEGTQSAQAALAERLTALEAQVGLVGALQVGGSKGSWHSSLWCKH